jgi:hypothetical protein
MLISAATSVERVSNCFNFQSMSLESRDVVARSIAVQVFERFVAYWISRALGHGAVLAHGLRNAKRSVCCEFLPFGAAGLWPSERLVTLRPQLSPLLHRRPLWTPLTFFQL